MYLKKIIPREVIDSLILFLDTIYLCKFKANYFIASVWETNSNWVYDRPKVTILYENFIPDVKVEWDPPYCGELPIEINNNTKHNFINFFFFEIVT